MRSIGFVDRSLPALIIVAMTWMFVVAVGANAQGARLPSGTLDAGTTISVRTTGTISARNADGRVFSGVVDQDVPDRSGNVAIPRGSNVELIVKRASDNDLAVDLDAITINDRRYGVDVQENNVTADEAEGIGANSRTGKYVGGGALLGAVIGAIAGGGKGAAIGAGAGAAAGAGAQVLTKGRTVNIPAETLLTFRLDRAMRYPVVDTGFYRNGTHYHTGYSNDTPSVAYRAGLDAGRLDGQRNLPRTARSTRWSTTQQRSDYQVGYNRGYDDETQSSNNQQGSRERNLGHSAISIGRNNNIAWNAPQIVRVYVQSDNDRRQLFAEGRAGNQNAPWIATGHVYTFTMQDLNGNELTREKLDLRQSRQR